MLPTCVPVPALPCVATMVLAKEQKSCVIKKIQKSAQQEDQGEEPRY